MHKLLLTIFLAIGINAVAQDSKTPYDSLNHKAADVLRGIETTFEISGQTGTGDFAPLWMSANKHGVVSPYSNAAYERVSLQRCIDNDSTHRWGIGYGIDLVFAENAQSWFMVHQAYAEARFMKAKVTLGAKERETDMRYNELTSGGLSLGTNSTPIPMLRCDVDYFSIPGTKQWWKWRGRIAYGMTTDGNWQRKWVANPQSMRYNSNILYHEKALYWKFGRKEKFPLTYEIGIQMMTQFGGTIHNPTGRGVDTMDKTLKMDESLNAFWHALWPMGSSDATDGVNKNAAGNTLGSYNMALAWEGEEWMVRVYFERFYEDHSMLTVQYGIDDHLLGIDAALPHNPYVSHILVEHINTRKQSGAVFHDGTSNMPDAIAGNDNYYNHNLYAGWQHWGMGIGNPLLSSPIYNTAHNLFFFNNRVKAWHIGMDGDPTEELHWKFMMSLTDNWGTYTCPLTEKTKQIYLMGEVNYTPSWTKGWSAALEMGYDNGKITGNNFGAGLKVRKKI